MLNRFVTNWLREQAQDALLRGFEDATGNAGDGASASDEVGPIRTAEVVLFFPNANQAAGLVDQMTGASVHECHGFTERLGDWQGRPLAVIESQLHGQGLARMVHDVISLRKPRWVVASGFAISLHPDVQRGHILVADRLLDASGYSLDVPCKMPTSKTLHVGTLLSRGQEDSDINGDAIPSDVLAWDIQAALIGEVCRQLKTKMLAIHGIFGDASQREGKLTQELRSQDNLAGVLGAAAGALVQRPSSWKDWWNDKEASLISADRLAKFLAGVVQQLP